MPDSAQRASEGDTGGTAVEVSVVIPARNAASTLAAQLEALARQRTGRRYEVLVADNGSTDGTAAVVAAWTDRVPGLRLVDASRREGSNVARNVGTQAAAAELVLLCDADDVVDEGWLEALAGGLDDADGVGGRLERVSLNPDFVRAWGEPKGQPGIVVQHEFLPRPISANAGYRKAVWAELGGFDEAYVRGGAETEFFWRLQLAGHTLLDVPDAVVHYRMRSNFRLLVRQMYIWGRQSPMLYRDFRDRGMPRDLKGSLRAWGWLLKGVGRLHRTPRDRLVWCRNLGYRVGRIVGSFRYHVLYP